MRKVIKRIFQGEREKKNEDSVKTVLSLKKKTEAKGGVYLLFIEMIHLLQREQETETMGNSRLSFVFCFLGKKKELTQGKKESLKSRQIL